MKLRCGLDAVVNRTTFERLGTLDADAARLERAYPSSNHHRAGIEGLARRRSHQEAAIVTAGKLGHFIAQVKRRMKRLDLFQQPVDQLLCTAHRQRGDVVDRLLGVELGALPARDSEGVQNVGADAQQSELEDLE